MKNAMYSLLALGLLLAGQVYAEKEVSPYESRETYNQNRPMRAIEQRENMPSETERKMDIERNMRSVDEEKNRDIRDAHWRDRYNEHRHRWHDRHDNGYYDSNGHWHYHDGHRVGDSRVWPWNW